MKTTIIFLLLVIILVMLIVSDSKKLTCSSSIGYVIKTILNWIKSILPKNEVCYPTGIGYDTNGCFCPGAVEKEFEDLGTILDGLYLSNHTYNVDLFGYDFKFARVKNDMNGIELYDYIDKKVLSSVQHYLHRIGNNRVSDCISSITLDGTDLMIYLARTRNGEVFNYNWRNSQRNAYNERNAEQKKLSGPIEITWKES